jgi:hypothetical protein
LADALAGDHERRRLAWIESDPHVHGLIVMEDCGMSKLADKLGSCVMRRLSIATYCMTLLLLLPTEASSQQFDHSKICEAIKSGWEMRILYRLGEGERVFAPRYLGYTKRDDVILNGLANLWIQ